MLLTGNYKGSSFSFHYKVLQVDFLALIKMECLSK